MRENRSGEEEEGGYSGKVELHFDLWMIVMIDRRPWNVVYRVD